MGGEDAVGRGAVEEGGPLEQDGPGRRSLDLGLRRGAGRGKRQQDSGEEPDSRTRQGRRRHRFPLLNPPPWGRRPGGVRMGETPLNEASLPGLGREAIGFLKGGSRDRD